MKAMTSANSATASVSAKPRSTLPNTRGAASGLRSAPETKLPKMLPMPMPTPARAMVARPAPMSLAAAGVMVVPSLVTEMNGVVEIEAGQDREDIGLQESDQQLEADEDHDEGKRRPAADDAQHHHEAAEHLEHGVAGQHVGEQPDRQAEGAHEVRDDLDRHQQQEQHERHALGHEQRQEVGAVPGEADDRDTDEHHRRHREGHDD